MCCCYRLQCPESWHTSGHPPPTSYSADSTDRSWTQTSTWSQWWPQRTWSPRSKRTSWAAALPAWPTGTRRRAAATKGLWQWPGDLLSGRCSRRARTARASSRIDRTSGCRVVSSGPCRLRCPFRLPAQAGRTPGHWCWRPKESKTVVAYLLPGIHNII